MARIFFVIGMLPQMELNLSNILFNLVNGGIVFYGGLFGVIIGIVISSKLFKKDAARTRGQAECSRD